MLSDVFIQDFERLVTILSSIEEHLAIIAKSSLEGQRLLAMRDSREATKDGSYNTLLTSESE